LNQGLNAKSMSFIKQGDQSKKNTEPISSDKTKDTTDMSVK